MKIFLLILILCIIAVALIIIADVNRFVTRKYAVYSEKIDREYNIVLLADMHNKEFGKGNYKLIRKIRDINPDFVCMAGDMITSKPGYDFSKGISICSHLSDFPVFYGLGNHEYRMKIYTDTYKDAYERYKEALMKMGVHVLENNHWDIDNSNIRIQGIMLERDYYKRFRKITMDESYIANLIDEPIDRNKYNIILAHNPEYFVQYAKTGGDLILSGHVHGGIARLPFFGGVISPKPDFFPKFDGGIYCYESGKMVLSRGLGYHTIPIRFLNPGELVHIRLLPGKDI